MIKRIAGLLAALCLLGGCAAAEFDASRYVQGVMDSTYLEKYDDYMALTGATAEQAQEEFLEGLDAEAEVFLQYCGVESVSQPVRDEIVSLYREIYQKSKYTVGPAQKTDGGYSVEVKISPIDLFSICSAAVNEKLDGMVTALDSEMSDAELGDYLVGGIIEVMRDYIPKIGYGEEQTVQVQVVEGKDGLYGLSGDDFYRLDEKIIDYPA